MAKPTGGIAIKILLIGDSGVGKTSILYRYTDDVFSNSYITTIGIDFMMKSIHIDGNDVKLQIWDTAGQERFQTMTAAYFRNADGVMIVYDITNRQSFENLRNWLENINEYASVETEKLLIGNKCDLGITREVETSEAEQIAASSNIEFVEISAKSNVNVELAFNKLCSNILKKVIPKRIPAPLPEPMAIRTSVEKPKRKRRCARCRLI